MERFTDLTGTFLLDSCLTRESTSRLQQNNLNATTSDDYQNKKGHRNIGLTRKRHSRYLLSSDPLAAESFEKGGLEDEQTSA